MPVETIPVKMQAVRVARRHDHQLGLWDGQGTTFPRRGIVKSANQGDGKSLSVALSKRFSLPRPSDK